MLVNVISVNYFANTFVRFVTLGFRRERNEVKPVSREAQDQREATITKAIRKGIRVVTSWLLAGQQQLLKDSLPKFEWQLPRWSLNVQIAVSYRKTKSGLVLLKRANINGYHLLFCTNHRSMTPNYPRKTRKRKNWIKGKPIAVCLLICFPLGICTLLVQFKFDKGFCPRKYSTLTHPSGFSVEAGTGCVDEGSHLVAVKFLFEYKIYCLFKI